MNWADHREWIRYYLRDPDGNIWSDALLLRLFNDESQRLQVRKNVLEKIEVLRIPPFFEMAITQPWEWDFVDHTAGKVYEAFNRHDQSGFTFCNNWEAQELWGLSGTVTAQEGTQYTQPWEAFAGITAAKPVPFHFPDDFREAIYLSLDRREMEASSQKILSSLDPSWQTTGGEAVVYWRPDSESNLFHVYPLQTTNNWNDVEELPELYDFGYTQDWEAEGNYLSGNGFKFTVEDSVHGTENTYVWEDVAEGEDKEGTIWTETVPGTWLDAAILDNQQGMLLFAGSETVNDQLGTVVNREGSYMQPDQGIAIDTVDDEDNITLVFKVVPVDLVVDTDESAWPDFLAKYVRYAVLERAFGANTDGRIESLRDYWGKRKKLGDLVIDKFLAKRRTDRDYRLRTKGGPSRRLVRDPRLPDNFANISHRSG